MTPGMALRNARAWPEPWRQASVSQKRTPPSLSPSAPPSPNRNYLAPWQKGEAKARLAISDLNSGKVYVFDARDGSDKPLAEVEVGQARRRRRRTTRRPGEGTGPGRWWLQGRAGIGSNKLGLGGWFLTGRLLAAAVMLQLRTRPAVSLPRRPRPLPRAQVHRAPVAAMRYCAPLDVVVSTDTKGG
jgi:hypothetical protein